MNIFLIEPSTTKYENTARFAEKLKGHVVTSRWMFERSQDQVGITQVCDDIQRAEICVSVEFGHSWQIGYALGANKSIIGINDPMLRLFPHPRIICCTNEDKVVRIIDRLSKPRVVVESGLVFLGKDP